MSRDTDAQQRLWLSLGYGGRSKPQPAWRYWETEKGSKQWIISAPNELAEFEQHGNKILYQGEVVVTARTHWAATWGALAYFYETILPTLTPPALDKK
jgi:hypothetical protein